MERLHKMITVSSYWSYLCAAEAETRREQQRAQPAEPSPHRSAALRGARGPLALLCSSQHSERGTAARGHTAATEAHWCACKSAARAPKTPLSEQKRRLFSRVFTVNYSCLFEVLIKVRLLIKSSSS